MKDLVSDNFLSISREMKLFNDPSGLDRLVPVWKEYKENTGSESIAIIAKKTKLLSHLVTFLVVNLDYDGLAAVVITSQRITDVTLSEQNTRFLGEFSHAFLELNTAINSMISRISQLNTETLSAAQEEALETHAKLVQLLGALKTTGSLIHGAVWEKLLSTEKTTKIYPTIMRAILEESLADPITTGSTFALLGFIISGIIVIASGGTALSVAGAVTVLGKAASVAGFSYSAGYIGHSFCLTTSPERRDKLVRRFSENTLREVVGLLAALLPLVSFGCHGMKTLSSFQGGILASDEVIGAASSTKKMMSVLENSRAVTSLLFSFYGTHSNVKTIHAYMATEKTRLRHIVGMFREEARKLPPPPTEKTPMEKSDKNPEKCDSPVP